MNFELKGNLIRIFGTQSDAARAIGISESRLSRIVRERSEATAEEKAKFERILGKREVEAES